MKKAPPFVRFQKRGAEISSRARSATNVTNNGNSVIDGNNVIHAKNAMHVSNAMIALRPVDWNE